MTKPNIDALKVDDQAAPFRFIDPPFSFNAPTVSQYPPEVTGYFLLETLRRRMQFKTLADVRLLDFGCGVRFARAIYNLNLDIGLYVGVDVHREAINWLQQNIADPRFAFVHLDIRNNLYNPLGSGEPERDALRTAGVPVCDAACMFSVITHQNPAEARFTFGAIRRCVERGGQLYFTAFADETVADYIEGAPDKPGIHSIYNPSMLVSLLSQSGWRAKAIFQKAQLQQTPFLCEAE